MKKVLLLFFLTLVSLSIYSFIFVDSNLKLSSSEAVISLQVFLKSFLEHNRVLTGIAYILFVFTLYACYFFLLRFIQKHSCSIRTCTKVITILILPLLFSFPSFSYDMFNYIATAKVAFHWKENPWVTMPVDIPNEPALAYTRAANKVALYGPTWIYSTYISHIAGVGNVYLSILSFRLLVVCFFIVFIIILYKKTQSIFQTMFFACNPLVLMEVVLGGHNDIVMMFLASTSLLIIQKKRLHFILSGLLLWFLSIGVKGATIVLLPTFLLFRKHFHFQIFTAFLLMFIVFMFTPLREEMYPWYAVWWLSFLVFLPYQRYKLIYHAAGFFSFGLVLRHAPYIFMGYYEGYGPLIRFILMVVPVIVWMGIEWKSIIRQLKMSLKQSKTVLWEKVHSTR